MKEHVFLGTDSCDAEALRDQWLSENPTIKVLRMHPPRREPLSLLVRLGGRNVPRILNNGGLRGSVANERRMNSLAAFATKENDREHNKRNS